MAKKSKARVRTGRPPQPPPQRAAVQRRWYLKLVVGGVILALALGIGAVVRFRQQHSLAPRLQGVVDGHYTRGVVGAPVIIKEFSDYT